MLARAAVAAARPTRTRAIAARRLSTKGQASIFTDKHLFPDQVLEEEKTGHPVGLPQIREADLWKPGAEETLVRPTVPCGAWPWIIYSARLASALPPPPPPPLEPY